ncbi:MAG: PBP2-transglycosylase/transpeptidase [Simkaniaceae bacterium]
MKKKANHIFHLFLIAMVLIAIRIWYLEFFQYNYYLKISRLPQRRAILEPACRGTIHDRFGIPLAINKIQYQAAVYYDPIRQIPRTAYKRSESGKRIKYLKRKEYVERLAQFLAKELDLDPVKIEDIIYSRASIFPTTPFVIKEELAEEEYYRLKFLEKDWPGIQALMQPKRVYPQGKVAADIIGYMGRINQREYTAIAHEKFTLQEFLLNRENQLPVPLPAGFKNMHEVRERLRTLEQKAYTINDYVGKSGIEGKFDKQLRGSFGKKYFEVDVKGNILRGLPGSIEAAGGQDIQLSISAELQEFAEALLAQHEIIRDKRFVHAGKNNGKQPNPWIKGGAIAAVIPKTGEIVALASYPRFNPNDFIRKGSREEKNSKQKNINRWLETEHYIADLWDGKQNLKRESYSLVQNKWDEEERKISWEFYLKEILSPDSRVLQAAKKIENLQTAYNLLYVFSRLLSQKNLDAGQLIDYLYPESASRISQENVKRTAEEDLAYRQILDKHLAPIPHNIDKLLLLDLCKLCVDLKLFCPELLNHVGSDSIEEYRSFCQAFTSLQDEMKKTVRKFFRGHDFAKWRSEHFQVYLKKQRKEEKKSKRYEKPYLDYLKIKERELFQDFWEENRYFFYECVFLKQPQEIPEALRPYYFLLSEWKERLPEEQSRLFALLHNRLRSLEDHIAIAYLRTMKGYRDLNEPLYGKYRNVISLNGKQLTRHLARAFYPAGGFGYPTSFAYHQITPLGSLFKIVTGYESLRQKYEKKPSDLDLNPLTIIDDLHPELKSDKGIVLGYTLDGKPITQKYKGGRLPRSSHRNIGRVDFLKAMEQSSNIYFSLLASETLANPGDLVEAARRFGFGQKTGIDLTGEASGYLPNDIRDNVTSLYSFAIGQHTLLVTPIQAAQMLSIIASEGEVLHPQIIKKISGLEYKPSQEIFLKTTDYPYEKNLHLAGIYFPFFSEALGKKFKFSSKEFSPQIKEHVFMPLPIRNYLLESLYQVMIGERGSARYQAISYLYQYPKVRASYRKIQKEMVGKTGTAEIYYRPTIDREGNPILCKHLWFGAISFAAENDMILLDHPELAVIVLLRYGDWGKEAAPLAAQIIEKWRELKKKYEEE